jgi:hypothetical protein
MSAFLFIFAILLTFQNFFKMEKFLKVAVTGLGDQLISISNVKLIDEATSTAVTTTILHGRTTTTLTHAADTAFSVLLALQNAMANALQSTDYS